MSFLGGLTKGVIAVEIRDYLGVLRRRWVSILIVALATLAVAAAVTFALTPRYTATTRLFFGVQGAQSGSDLAQGSTFAEKQLVSYAQVSTSPLVLGQVVTDLGLDMTPEELATRVEAAAPTDTVILEISVEDVDGARAAQIANAIGQRLSSVAGDLSPERQDGSQSVRATILAPAQVPTEPSSPNVLRNLAAGLLLGLLLGVGVAILRRVLDTKVRNELDVQSVTDSSILGLVPFDAGAPDHPVVMHDDPLGARSEAIRRLRTNLQFVELAAHARSIVVSSSVPGEGKSSTTINLAVSLADAGLKVALIDADLRRPSIARYLGMEGSVGLTTVLIGEAELGDVLQPWRDTSLSILPAGQVPPNPSELLGSKAMSALLEQMSGTFDMVLIDSPPLLPVTDAAILGRLAGGTLVVVGADRLHRPQLRMAMESLSAAGANVFGMVLNKVARGSFGSYGYGYGYTSDEVGGGAKTGAGDDGSSRRKSEKRRLAAQS